MDTVQKFCDQCGVEVPAGSRFCGLCGHQLGQPTVGLLPGSGSEGDSETLDYDALNPVQRSLAQQKTAIEKRRKEREDLEIALVSKDDSETLDSDVLNPVQRMLEQQKTVKGRKEEEGIEVPWLFGPVVEDDSETLDSDVLNPVQQRLAQQKTATERFKRDQNQREENSKRSTQRFERDQERQEKKDKEKADTLANIGIGLGIIALGFIPVLFGPIGVILGAVASSKGSDRGIIAVVVAIVGTVAGIFIGILVWS